MFEYSPESFTGTELDFAVSVCDAVNEVLAPTPEHPAIINLPATVEMSTPNIYADQIEWFCDHVKNRDALIISLHTHNDRGCAVAAAELGVMAGADRVEGTLLGNGERTGNMDIMTMAMNLYSQGVDPKLDFTHMDEICTVARECTQLPVHPRHPYAGELVFTAFSGSHQDAIHKCLSKRDDNAAWDVAYLPIDPADIGRTYQEVIRINSQSGKGGVAHVLRRDYGLELPRWLQVDFSAAVQDLAEDSEAEVSSDDIFALFTKTYLSTADRWQLGDYQLSRQDGSDGLQVTLHGPQGEVALNGSGSGVVDAFVQAMERFTGRHIVLVEYSEHTLGSECRCGGSVLRATQYRWGATLRRRPQSRYCAGLPRGHSLRARWPGASYSPTPPRANRQKVGAPRVLRFGHVSAAYSVDAVPGEERHRKLSSVSSSKALVVALRQARQTAGMLLAVNSLLSDPVHL